MFYFNQFLGISILTRFEGIENNYLYVYKKKSLK